MSSKPTAFQVPALSCLIYATRLLRYLHTSQEAEVRTKNEKNWLVQNWEKSVTWLYTLTCLFNFYTEYITRNSRLDESRAGIKIAGRNINNLSSVDDTTPMAESEEELKNLLTNVKQESEKAGLKLNIHKTKILVASPITS